MYMNFTYDIYVQLYNASVVPTLLYGTESWGYIKSKSIVDIQKRALRFFMGVHKFTPIPAMMGDMGWVGIEIKQSLCMIRYWNRLLEMDHTRLTKRIFLWDYNLITGTWSNEVLKIFTSIDSESMYTDRITCNVNVIEMKLLEIYETQWRVIIGNIYKLKYLDEIWSISQTSINT